MSDDLSYQRLHWGTSPDSVEDMSILDKSCVMVPVAELVAISYATVKNGKPDVYRHEFKKINGRGPYLLELPDREPNEDEGFRPPKGGTRSEAMGRVVDMECADGSVIFPTFYWVCTTPRCPRGEKGGPVLLGNRFDPLYAIEHRKYRNHTVPYIREHGIID
jgi:hypothetical protein